MRVAAIADIHSNSLALEAVLEDIAQQAVDQIVQLGDAFNGPIDPRGVAEIIRSMPMIHIRGNGERMVLSSDPRERSRSADYARDILDPATLDWVRGWPRSFSCSDYFAFHATPTNDSDYLVESLVPGGWTLRTRRQIASHLVGVSSPLVLCGHTHVPQFVRIDEQRAIVNPGSVGLPAYADTQPIRHSMQAGSPEARYAIVDVHGSKLSVAHRSVPYDHRRAAQMAMDAGFADWVPALMSGYAEEAEPGATDNPDGAQRLREDY